MDSVFSFGCIFFTEKLKATDCDKLGFERFKNQPSNKAFSGTIGNPSAADIILGVLQG